MKYEKHYQNIINFLKEQSAKICSDNECTEDNHNCESYAYFDYYKADDKFELVGICLPDYCQRIYDSCIPLPFDGSIEDLVNELENNLIG